MQLEAKVLELEERLAAAEKVAQTLTPWIGPEGQLRVRLERAEQAIFALIQDPLNPAVSAEQARAILTAIPVPIN